jgi:DNA-binding GntR family transcriptional regulator
MTTPIYERAGIGWASDPAGTSEHSKADRVYHHLRRLIRETKLPPGTHIRKDLVAAELGVSLAPVSQALSWLAEDMLVDIRPRHGSFVAPILAHDLRECMFLRKALEVEAARLVAAEPDQHLVENLEQNFERQQQALRTGDLYRLYDLDADFHGALMLATAYRRVAHITITARVAVDRPRQFARIMVERAEATVAEHRRIIDAIALKDPDLAAATMLSHLKRASQSLELALAQIEAAEDLKADQN